MNPFVYVKQDSADLPVNLNLTSLMQVGEFAVPGSVTLVSIAPVSPTPLTVTSLTVSATALTANLVGGNDTISYGVRLRFTTTFGATKEILLAVVVHSDMNVPYATKNPYAYQSLVDEVQSGDGAVGKGFFVLPAGTNVASSYVTWELMNQVGEVFASGNAYDISASINTHSTVVEANAVIHVPSAVPPSIDNQKYQIRWSLIDASQPTATPQHAFEAIRVLGLTSVPTGVQDTVEMVGDISTIQLVTQNLYDTVGFEVYAGIGNALLVPYTEVPNPKRVSSGWFYTASLNTAALGASLAPYIVSWKYSNTAVPGSLRETARVYVINASISNAIEDSRMFVNKAKSTLFGFADMMFDTNTLIGFLRRGMDMFNAAGGVPTTYDMTDATGGVRDYWMGYAEVVMLQAQALAEGEKAFDFQGQAIQLTVDRTQYYNQLADSTLQRLETSVRPYKTALAIKGGTGGTGNVTAPGAFRGNMPKLGITVHQASQFGRHHGPWNW